MSKAKKGQTKKAQLKESLKNTLELALDCYPDLKNMLKKDLTIDEMASDIMASLEEFTPSAMTQVQVTLGKKMKKLATKLRL